MSTFRMIGMLAVCAGLGYAVWLDNTSGGDDAAPAPARVEHRMDGQFAVQPDAAAGAARLAAAQTVEGPADSNPASSGENPEAAAAPDALSEAPSNNAQSEHAEDGSTGAATVGTTPDDNQVTNPLSSVEIGILSDTVERPLFAASRQRPPPKPDSAEPDKAQPTFELLGVAINGARATAILRRKEISANFSVETGDTLSGWKVSRIEPSAVVLEGPEGAIETIKLLRN